MPQYTSPAEQIVFLEKKVADLEKSYELLNSFYKLTVMERDYERRKYDDLRDSLRTPGGGYSDIVSDGGLGPR